MNSPLANSSAGLAADAIEQTLENQILEIIGDVQPLSPDERRSRDRYPIYCCMQLIPLDSSQRPVLEATIPAIGKDLSTNGVCFSHEQKILHNRVIVSLTYADCQQFHVEAEIAWTRQTPIGLYETGCRLIRKIEDRRSDS